MIVEDELFSRFRGKDILLDTNLLLLFLVGSFERQRIHKFKRTAEFSEADFDLLARFLQEFRKILTTPHILTEVSNLTNSLPSHLQKLWSTHFARQTNAFLEIFEASEMLMKRGVFHQFGLADAAIHSLSSDALVLTEDFRLAGFLRSENLPVLNFRELAMVSRFLG